MGTACGLRARSRLARLATPTAIDCAAPATRRLLGTTMDISFDQGLHEASAAYESQDYRLAFKRYRRLALQGSVPAQRWVALMLDYGEGVPKDQALAARWYRTAAEQGDAQSQNNLGVDWAKASARTWPRRPAGSGARRSRATPTPVPPGQALRARRRRAARLAACGPLVPLGRAARSRRGGGTSRRPSRPDGPGGRVGRHGQAVAVNR